MPTDCSTTPFSYHIYCHFEISLCDSVDPEEYEIFCLIFDKYKGIFQPFDVVGKKPSSNKYFFQYTISV